MKAVIRLKIPLSGTVMMKVQLGVYRFSFSDSSSSYSRG